VHRGRPDYQPALGQYRLLALLFGVGDVAGFLLGSALHYSVPDSVGTFVQEATLIILGGLLDRGRHPVEEGGERGAAAVQIAVGRVDPAVGAERRQLPAGRAWRYPALGSRLDGGDGRGLRRDRDDRLVVDEVRKEMGGDRGADQEDGR